MRKLVVSLLVSFFVNSLNGSESIHVVQKNQTLGGIARKYGVSIATLQAYNSITDPNLLFQNTHSSRRGFADAPRGCGNLPMRSRNEGKQMDGKIERC